MHCPCSCTSAQVPHTLTQLSHSPWFHFTPMVKYWEMKTRIGLVERIGVGEDLCALGPRFPEHTHTHTELFELLSFEPLQEPATLSLSVFFFFSSPSLHADKSCRLSSSSPLAVTLLSPVSLFLASRWLSVSWQSKPPFSLRFVAFSIAAAFESQPSKLQSRTHCQECS